MTPFGFLNLLIPLTKVVSATGRDVSVQARHLGPHLQLMTWRAGDGRSHSVTQFPYLYMPHLKDHHGAGDMDSSLDMVPAPVGTSLRS